jgi:hypothetical protein
MNRWTPAIGALVLTMVAVGEVGLHAQSVQFTLRDGRVSLVAENATPAQIFKAWSDAGGVLIVNADQMPSAPLTLKLEDVPEEQALDTLLRSVSGYLARRRVAAAGPTASTFDRVVILPTPPAAAPATIVSPQSAERGPNAMPVFPQSPRIAPPGMPQPAPNGIQQGPGVMRLIGPDGRPVEDDQADAPPYNAGDVPDSRTPRPVPVPPPTQGQPQPPSTSAPVGVPVPGMVVPTPNSPGQPASASPGQPTQQSPGQTPQ